MDTKELLQRQINRILEKMEDMDICSDDYKTASELVTKLTGRLDELDKSTIQWSAQAKEDARLEYEKKVHEDEEAFKAKQTKDERRKMIINTVVTILGVVIPAGVTVWGAITSLKFEETGTYTSAAGRAFNNRIFSKK